MTSTERAGGRRGAVLAAACVVALASCRGAAPGPPRPNVLLVCIDALRADHLGLYGAAPSPSPSLDALARESVVYENATSVASWTKPSVPSLLTGLYPREHGVFDNTGSHVDTLATGTTTLAEIFRAHGYRTAAFVENDQLLRRLSGLDRGFSLYFDQAGRPPDIVDRFLSWADDNPKKPWFAYLHFLDPHFPYVPDAFTFEDGEAAPLTVRTKHWDLDGEFWWLLRQRVNEGTTTLDSAALRDLDRLYRLEIRAVDASIGHMIRLLDDDGVLDRTVVVVTADHGEGFLEHGRLDHGYGPYDELLHVPLVVRLPHGQHGGSRRHALAQNVDIAPTVLESAGFEVPASWSSVSLRPTLQNDSAEVRETVFAEERHGHQEFRSVRDRRFSYLSVHGTAPPARPSPIIPASAVPGTRLRARGIFDGRHLVAGAVRHLAPGDSDTELQGPVESVDPVARTVRVLGVDVRIGDGVREVSGDADDRTLTVRDLDQGDLVRAHGTIDGGAMVPAKIERPQPDSIEIEGIVRRVDVGRGGDVVVDLGGASFVVDPRARWRDFPGDPDPKPKTVPLPTEEAPPSEQLFDRRSDPRELHDISATSPAELVRLREIADRTAQKLGKPAGAEGRVPLDDETRERLQALGYVE